MSRSDAGKGDRTRPFNRKKWDAGWDQYEKGKKNEDNGCSDDIERQVQKKNDVQSSNEAGIS